jgi:hypothetical protein
MVNRPTRGAFNYICVASFAALWAVACGDNSPAKLGALGGQDGSVAGSGGSGGEAAQDGGIGGAGVAGQDGGGGTAGTAGQAGGGGAGGGTGPGGRGGVGGAGQGGGAGSAGGGGGAAGQGSGGVAGGGGGAGAGGQAASGPDGGAGAGGQAASGPDGGAGVGGAGGTPGCLTASDCSDGKVCDGNTQTCIPCPSDNSCLNGYGPSHVCVAGACISGNCHDASACSDGKVCISNVCTACNGDPICVSSYGSGHLCVAGGCVAGECQTASNCPPGKICDATFACVDCGTDTDCVSGYGANHLCVNGSCIAGDCRQTSDCGGGRICDTSTFTCGPCPDDPTCVANYGANQLCVNGSCISGNCRTAANCTPGLVCDPNTFTCGTCLDDAACVQGYGANHLCVGGACVVGQCRTSPDCSGGQICDASTFSCGVCAGDPDCVTAYGTNHLCIGGACVSGTCHATSDCGGGEICDTVSHSCGPCATDAACVSAYGPQHLCVGNVCIPGNCHSSADCLGSQICDVPTHSCHACGSDAACQSDPSYGVTTVCVGGGCISGDCHGSSGDCPTGQLCGISVPDTCGACMTDAQCAADPQYGALNICFQGICQPGNCHGTSSDCAGPDAGLICGAVAANTCGPCATDSQCQADASYGPSTICKTTGVGSGTCVSATCAASGPCASNPGDFCCGSLCTPGNCCLDADCAANPMFGSVYRCVNNSCTGCAAATGNKYFVDPVGGNDAAATGSGIAGGSPSPSCSFKTVTRALQVSGGFAVAGTQIVIVGQSGQTVVLDPSETLPIVVPSNVAIATVNGPIRLNLPASADPNFGNVAGFQLGGDQAAIVPDPAAPLTIDGASQVSGIGIGVSPGAGKTTAISYVTIQNTGGNGIAVSNGTLNVGQGVTVTGAGTAAKRRDGLNVAGGTVNINVAAGQAGSAFSNNTQHGIYVTGAAVVNIAGVPVSPANGQGTVVANGNFFAGLRIFEAPGTAGASSVNGLVAWSNAQNGLRLYGGEKVKIRNGVYLDNGLNGVFITSYDGTAAGNDLSGIDLGKVGAPGRNQLQAALGSGPDLAGLCVGMATAQGALALSAEGNVFSGPTDCNGSNATLVHSAVCGGDIDLGVVPAVGTTVTVDVATCH